MICSVGNGRFIGGGIPSLRKADVTDGLFDIQLVDAVPRENSLYLPSLMMGTLFKHPPAHNYRASSCTFVLAAPCGLQLDGEILLPWSTRTLCVKATRC